MKFVAFVSVALLATLASAQDWAKARVDSSPRHLEWVDVKHGERTVKSFVAYPEREGKTPVVIVIHEIFGHTDWIQSVCDQLAEAGYIAIAPDLLSGIGPGGGRTNSFEDVGAAREAIGALNPDQITADLNAVFEYAKTIPSGNGKIVVSGFCWGGSQSFRYATNQPGLAAAVVFYGTGPTEAAEYAKITAPVYGFYGSNDNRVNATIPDSEKMMKEAGKHFHPVLYEGAGHGFLRAGEMPDATGPNVDGRVAAWKRWLDILSKL